MSSRPGTATVRIRSETRENPRPQSSPDPESGASQLVLDEYLTADVLRDLSGSSDLTLVQRLEFTVDTSAQSLGQFGILVPNLVSLRLSGSVASTRDLGTSLGTLTILWLSRCNLSSLDGIGALNRLKELYIAFNMVREFNPLTLLPLLSILDAEGNEISDLSQVLNLSMCPSLVEVTLEGNPIEKSIKNYRETVLQMIPSVLVFDGRIRQADCHINHGAFEAQLIQQNLKAPIDPSVHDETLPSTSASRPSTATPRPSTAPSRPLTATPRPLTATSRPLTATARLLTERSSRGKHDSFDADDSSSSLTHGSDVVFCGNPLKALKARRQNNDKEPNDDDDDDNGATILELRRLLKVDSPSPKNDDVGPGPAPMDLDAWRASFTALTRSMNDVNFQNVDIDDVFGDDDHAPDVMTIDPVHAEHTDESASEPKRKRFLPNAPFSQGRVLPQPPDEVRSRIVSGHRFRHRLVSDDNEPGESDSPSEAFTVPVKPRLPSSGLPRRQLPKPNISSS